MNVINRDGQLCIEITCPAEAYELQIETSKVLEVLYGAAKVAYQGVDAALSAETQEFPTQVASVNQEKARTPREI